jgi:simple sugar transport system ATP-binding protein
VTGAPALALERITKQFDDVTALNEASLVVRPGTVHALLGENGAGKTTLMRIAFGLQSRDAGTVCVHGSNVRITSPADAIALGIGMVHQHFTLVPAMTVAENLALGGRGRFDIASTGERVRALAQQTGLTIDADARVSDLSVASQQRLELLKALAREARILIFDEPTAVLAPSEAEELLRRLRQLADRGCAVVLITHKLREALSVADDITVLRRGETVLTQPRANVDEEALIEAMIGQRSVQTLPQRRPHTPRPPIISARDVSVADVNRTIRVRHASFDIHGGEIVGVAAVEGSGHRELLRAVARRIPVSAGVLEVPGAVGFVPDDRHRDGLVLRMSLTENYMLRGAAARRGTVRWADAARATNEIIRQFDVRAPSSNATAATLSGGNQQKFVLGRELEGPPAALVIENPTRGLDILATTFVQNRLLQARADGVAMMVYSSDLEEVVALADRVFVVYGGVVREVAVDGDVIGRAMLGALE